MATNIKIKKIVKHSKLTDFNGNGYLLGVRHADHMANISVCYGDHLEPKMVVKIQRSSESYNFRSDSYKGNDFT
jgi:hypothetical protein